MLLNHLKISLRHLARRRGYSLLTIGSLTTGMLCGLFITLYLWHELSYDRYHAKAERIYRVVEYTTGADEAPGDASVPFPLGPTLRAENPALVQDAVRFFNFWAPSLNLTYTPQKRFNEKKLYFTDPSVFRVFDFGLVKGDPARALAGPNAIVLTQAMATKYFGAEEPLGKVLRFENKYPLTVTGVLADLPATSHFTFDFLVSISTLEPLLTERQKTSWFWNPCWTYLLVPDGSAATRRQLDRQVQGLVGKYFPEGMRKTTALRTQPLTEIHLHSNLGVELAPNGDVRYVYLLAAIGAFVLLIAGVNFVNLATARSARRAAEIGIRKANGAGQSSLVRQFLLESTLVSLLAATGALALLWLLLPFFNAFTGKALTWGDLPLAWLLPGLLGAAAVVGVLAGLYPAAFLASFRPQQVLKGHFRPQGNVLFRRALVVGQFVIAVLLLVGTGVISNQLAHLRNARLGFDQEQVLLIPINRSALTTLRGYELFKEQLLRHPRVQRVTAAEQILGVDFNAGSYRPEGVAEPMLLSRMTVQHDFVETFRIPLAAGRSFSKQFATDTSRAVMVNEALVKHLGWTSPRAAIGKRLDVGPFPARIIGVLKDFRTASLHKPVEPFVLQMPRSDAAMEFFIKYLAVRIGPGDPAPVLAYVEKLWNSRVPDKAFEFSFLDERLDGQYRLEENTARVVGAFTGVAIFLACLGLLGLISFTAERRTKEIGIRKVLGAPVRTVAFLLVKEFIGLVLVANAIAMPLAWWLLGHWLSYFTEKAPLPYSVAGVALGVTVGVTLLTTGYHALKAANQNPVQALRTD